MTTKAKLPEYTVIRDTQEKVGFWDFKKYERCLGTIDKKLVTGDYTLKGYEEIFTIERKRNTSEFAQNLYQDRFHRELERMELMTHPYLFLEFTWTDMVCFPAKSGVPPYLLHKLKTTSHSLIKTYHEIRLRYPKIQVEFVGTNGQLAASSLFKRITERYEKTKV